MVKSKYSDVELAARIREFCDRLDVVSVGRSCDMMEPNITHNECGTPGCHAGWAAIALRERFSDYVSGAAVLNNHFGFDFFDPLEPNFLSVSLPISHWGGENPEIWGNELGRYMFCECRSFGLDVDIFPAEVLSTHWRGVADRLDPPAKRKHEKRELIAALTNTEVEDGNDRQGKVADSGGVAGRVDEGQQE